MYRAVIVDDEPIILEGLAKNIPWESYNIEIAGRAYSGEAAWSIIEEEEIDILITDIRMPRMSGLELISRIREAGKNVKCIVLSGHSDFRYVKESARLGIENYLLKPINLEECSATLEEIVNKLDRERKNQAIMSEGLQVLRENVLQRWLGGTIDEWELRERAEMLDIKLEGGFTAVCIYWGKTDTEDIGVKREIVKLCMRSIEQPQHGYVVLQPDNSISFLLFSREDGRFSEFIRKITEKILVRIEEMTGRTAAAAMGTYQHSFTGAAKSYRQAREAAACRMMHGDLRTVSFEEFSRYKAESLKNTKDFFDRIDALNVIENRRDLMQHVNNLIENVGRTALRTEQIYSICILAVSHTLQTTELLQPKTKPFLAEIRERMAEVYAISERELILEWMRGNIAEILKISREVIQNHSSAVLKILKFVERDYDKQINLKTIAAEMEMNSLYLGQIFAAEVGERFTDYVNKYRIEHAKRLLRRGESVKTAAGESGYVNLNYFYSVFKKHAGMSPNDFREEEQEN